MQSSALPSPRPSPSLLSPSLAPVPTTDNTMAAPLAPTPASSGSSPRWQGRLLLHSLPDSVDKVMASFPRRGSASDQDRSWPGLAMPSAPGTAAPSPLKPDSPRPIGGRLRHRVSSIFLRKRTSSVNLRSSGSPTATGTSPPDTVSSTPSTSTSTPRAAKSTPSLSSHFASMSILTSRPSDPVAQERKSPCLSEESMSSYYWRSDRIPATSAGTTTKASRSRSRSRSRPRREGPQAATAIAQKPIASPGMSAPNEPPARAQSLSKRLPPSLHKSLSLPVLKRKVSPPTKFVPLAPQQAPTPGLMVVLGTVAHDSEHMTRMPSSLPVGARNEPKINGLSVTTPPGPAKCAMGRPSTQLPGRSSHLQLLSPAGMPAPSIAVRGIEAKELNQHDSPPHPHYPAPSPSIAAPTTIPAAPIPNQPPRPKAPTAGKKSRPPQPLTLLNVNNGGRPPPTSGTAQPSPRGRSLPRTPPSAYPPPSPPPSIPLPPIPVLAPGPTGPAPPPSATAPTPLATPGTGRRPSLPAVAEDQGAERASLVG